MRARRRPSHATVVAYLALFVALGGSSYAAVTVTSKQIANNTVRSKDVRNNDIRSKDVRDASLLAKDFKAGQLPAGPQGPTGPQGPQGTAGADATKLFAYILDQGATAAATIHYGSGAVSVDDPMGESSYTVTFNRDLTNCVATATTGRGNPGGAAAGGTAYGEFIEVLPTQVRVSFYSDNETTPDDGSFMIAVFC